MANHGEITPKQLARLIGAPDRPALIDVRIDEDFAADPFVAPGALRRSHEDVAQWGADLRGRRCVVICQKGKKLSHGAAAILRALGVKAEVLAGGSEAWRDCGAPRIDGEALVALAGRAEGTRWVTRHRPKIDRIACPWLVRRFVDEAAQFLFVPPAETLAVAERFDAVAFDVAGAPLSHAGDRCAFDAFLARFGLVDPALERLASIVRAADLGGDDGAPEAKGVLAVALGLSRQYRDDLAQLEAGMIVFDALYRWARDASDETHDWQDHAK